MTPSTGTVTGEGQGQRSTTRTDSKPRVPLLALAPLRVCSNPVLPWPLLAARPRCVLFGTQTLLLRPISNSGLMQEVQTWGIIALAALLIMLGGELICVVVSFPRTVC